MRLTLFFATILLAGQVGVPTKSFSSSHSGATARSQSRRRVTIPAGTRLLVRTTDDINSEGSPTGSRFTATLETNLELDGVPVAPNTTVKVSVSEPHSWLEERPLSAM